MTEVAEARRAKLAFGISYMESCWLFSPYGDGGWFDNSTHHNVGGNATPKAVARHIRKFVERYAEVGELR